MALWLYRLGRFSARRAWLVIVSWIVILGVVGGSAALFMGTMSNNFTIPGTETQQMADKLQADLPEASGGSGSVIFVSSNGDTIDTAEQQAISEALQSVTSVPTVKGIIDPFVVQEQLAAAKTQLTDGQAQLDAGAAAAAAQLAQAPTPVPGSPEAAAFEAQVAAGQQQLAEKQAELDAGLRSLESSASVPLVSENGKAAIAQIQFTESVNGVSPANRQLVQDRLNAVTDSGVTVYFSKDITEDVSELFGVAEVIGIAVAAAVLLIMLGSFLAAGLPLLMAVIGVGVGVGGTMALTSVIEMSSISPMLALMLGLAVGIDYCLFIVNRHRQQLAKGMELRESIARATGTSGNAVLFAGLTVVIALSALTVTGLPFLAVMGVSAAATVAVAVVVALTLTPAMLSLMGRRILSKRGWAKIEKSQAAHAAAVASSSAAETAEREQAAETAHSARGWGGFVTKHPVLMLVTAVVALGVVALPALGLRLALPDGGSEPVTSSAYQAFQLTGENFGDGMNGPIVVVASLPEGLTEASATALELDVADHLKTIENVEAAVPLSTSTDLRTAVFQVVPAEGSASASTVQVVHDLRAQKAEIEEKFNTSIGLTGQTAGNVDVSTKLGDALPPYLAIVVGLSLILLILVFRSILVPLLATAGFLLSLVAAFGGVVAVYQWGWLSAIFDVANPSAVLSFLPIIVIGVLFGLAMDYQVFIASGMREAYVHGQSAKAAVRTGFSHAAPVVTAAAIIMTSVFAGFIFSHLTMVRPMGFALAFGVLLDAFVVRMTIVPAAMHLMGKSAWWIPAWLDKILPDVDVEGAKLEQLAPLGTTTTPDDDRRQPVSV